jgi:hypothetical protein
VDSPARGPVDDVLSNRHAFHCQWSSDFSHLAKARRAEFEGGVSVRTVGRNSSSVVDNFWCMALWVRISSTSLLSVGCYSMCHV